MVQPRKRLMVFPGSGAEEGGKTMNVELKSFCQYWIFIDKAECNSKLDWPSLEGKIWKAHMPY